jgi:hypothetical protein
LTIRASRAATSLKDRRKPSRPRAARKARYLLSLPTMILY